MHYQKFRLGASGGGKSLTGGVAPVSPPLKPPLGVGVVECGLSFEINDVCALTRDRRTAFTIIVDKQYKAGLSTRTIRREKNETK